jgi:hypothetical protein
MTDSRKLSKPPDVPSLNTWRLRSYRVAADAGRPLTSRESVSKRLGPRLDLNYDSSSEPLLNKPPSVQLPLSARPATSQPPLRPRSDKRVQQLSNERPSTVSDPHRAPPASTRRASSTARQHSGRRTPSSSAGRLSLDAAPKSARSSKENNIALGNPRDVAMLEAWIDDLLQRSRARLNPEERYTGGDTQGGDNAKNRGLKGAGLDRESLCSLEVTAGAVDRWVDISIYIYKSSRPVWTCMRECVVDGRRRDCLAIGRGCCVRERV